MHFEDPSVNVYFLSPGKDGAASRGESSSPKLQVKVNCLQFNTGSYSTASKIRMMDKLVQV